MGVHLFTSGPTQDFHFGSGVDVNGGCERGGSSPSQNVDSEGGGIDSLPLNINHTILFCKLILNDKYTLIEF